MRKLIFRLLIWVLDIVMRLLIKFEPETEVTDFEPAGSCAGSYASA
jgi:hypothetical protein